MSTILTMSLVSYVVTVLTVLLGAVLIPYQLSEVERVREISSGRSNSAPAQMDVRSSSSENLYKFSDALFPPYDVSTDVSDTFCKSLSRI